MSVASLEEQYPYLRGHVYTLVEGGRSRACALCGAFRDEHPEDRQGSGEALPVAEARAILAEINRESPTPGPASTSGDGISQLLAPFAAGGRQRRRA